MCAGVDYNFLYSFVPSTNYCQCTHRMLSDMHPSPSSHCCKCHNASYAFFASSEANHISYPLFLYYSQLSVCTLYHFHSTNHMPRDMHHVLLVYRNASLSCVPSFESKCNFLIYPHWVSVGLDDHEVGIIVAEGRIQEG